MRVDKLTLTTLEQVLENLVGIRVWVRIRVRV